MEVEQLGGAQAGWSEEEASDVAQSSLSIYETNTECLSIPDSPQHSYNHIHNPRNIRAGIFGVKFSLSHCARKNLMVLPIIPFRNTCLRASR